MFSTVITFQRYLTSAVLAAMLVCGVACEKKSSAENPAPAASVA